MNKDENNIKIFKESDDIFIPNILKYNMTVNLYTNEQSFKSQFARQSLSFSKLNDTKNQTLKEIPQPFVHILSVSKYIFFMLHFPMKIIIDNSYWFFVGCKVIESKQVYWIPGINNRMIAVLQLHSEAGEIQ